MFGYTLVRKDEIRLLTDTIEGLQWQLAMVEKENQMHRINRKRVISLTNIK